MDLDKMISDVIRVCGFENEKTIGFCKLVEEYQQGKTYKKMEIILTYEEITGWENLWVFPSW